MLFVTHDLDEAVALGDRCVMFSGRPGHGYQGHDDSVAARPAHLGAAKGPELSTGMRRALGFIAPSLDGRIGAKEESGPH